MRVAGYISFTLLNVVFYAYLVSVHSDCVLPIPNSTLSSDVRDEIVSTNTETDPNIVVTITTVSYNCLVHAQNPNFYLEAGITIQYTVSDGSSGFYRGEYRCNGNSDLVYVDYSASSTIGNESFLSETFQRENCSSCSLTTGEDYLCVPCDNLCLDPSVSLGYCYGSSSSQCCNFILNGMCTTACPINFEGNSTNICVCENFWAGAQCDQCPIACVNGTHNADCSSCDCTSGYSGDLCDTNIDDCDPDPCVNNGTCSDEVNDYTCTCINQWMGKNCSNCDLTCNNGGQHNSDCSMCNCAPGYTGNMCDTDINDCDPDPCVNNGTCSDEVNDYTCTCINQWMGKNCSNCGLTCNNGGQQNSDCSMCNCAPGYTGSICDTNIDDCDPDPCVNNGTCSDEVNDYTCTCINEWMGKNCSNCGLTCNNGGQQNSDCSMCNCAPGYTGNICDTDIDDCDPDPCVNNGTCSDEVNDYTCTCINEWMGKNCSNCGLTCNNGGQQNSDCSMCNCAPGYTGNMCDANIDDCDPDPCVNNGTCSDEVNDYTCTCINEWMGKNCSNCGLTCNNGGQQNSDCSMCNCALGYTGNMCDANIDDCDPDPCVNNGTCSDEVNDYTCTCINEWMGKNCSNCGLTCNNGGQQNSDCSMCNCAPGYTGNMCDANIDDCDPDPCVNNGTCSDEVNDYTCTCINEWMGKNCSDCGLTCNNGGQQNSDCSMCNCAPGYTGNICDTDIDDCDPDPCVNNGTCSDEVNDYTCTCINEWMGKNCSYCCITCNNGGQHNSDCSMCNCAPGYTGNTCDTDIDDCDPDPCVNNGTCSDEVNDYTCTCINEWMGKNCSYCGITCNNGGQQNSDCAMCNCAPGYTGNMCDTDIDDCDPDPCVKNGTCSDEVNDYTCTCINEWMGKNCSNCGLTCNNGGQHNSDCAMCNCAPGYTGSMCDTDINDCDPDPCVNNGTCSDEVNDYTCTCINQWMGKNCSNCGLTCNNGAQQNSDCSMCNSTCEDSDNCNNGVCISAGELDVIEAAPSYCECIPAYIGTYCDEVISSCVPGACQNGGRCDIGENVEYNLPFTCACPLPFSGPNCQLCPLDGLCENNGVISSDCSRCICQFPYMGTYCTESQCSSNEVIDGNTCGDTCTTNNYEPSAGNQGICTACGIDNCVQCNVDATKCTECKNGFSEEDGECVRIPPGCGIENCALCFVGICTVCVANYSLIPENACGLIVGIGKPSSINDNTLAIILGSIAGILVICIILVAVLIGAGAAVIYYRKRKLGYSEASLEKAKEGLNIDNPLYESRISDSKQNLVKSL